MQRPNSVTRATIDKNTYVGHTPPTQNQTKTSRVKTTPVRNINHNLICHNPDAQISERRSKRVIQTERASEEVTPLEENHEPSEHSRAPSQEASYEGVGTGYHEEKSEGRTPHNNAGRVQRAAAANNPLVHMHSTANKLKATKRLAREELHQPPRQATLSAHGAKEWCNPQHENSIENQTQSQQSPQREVNANQEQGLNTNHDLCGRSVLVFVGETHFTLGKISGTVRQDIDGEPHFVVAFSVTTHGTATYSRNEINEILLPAGGETHFLYLRSSPNRQNLWEKCYEKYAYIRNSMITRNLDTFSELAEQEDVIRGVLCNFQKSTVINRPNLNESIRKTIQKFSSDKVNTQPKRVKFVLKSLLRALTYILECNDRRLHIGPQSQDIPVAPNLLQDFPEYGTDDFQTQAGLHQYEENFTQHDFLYDDTPPTEPMDPTARLDNGLLVNSWSATDALSLDVAATCPFKLVDTIPKELMSTCREAVKIIMKMLTYALKLPVGYPDRSKIQRRACIWYALFPSLCLRLPATSNNYHKTTKLISTRLNQVINEDLGPLINSWESDYLTATTKNRKIPIDTFEKRVKRAVRMVKTAEPHGISKAINLITGNGTTNCDILAVKQQMIDKHPQREITWDPHICEEDRSDDFKLLGLNEIIDKADPHKAAGPRGWIEPINFCIHRAQPLNQPEGKTAMDYFEDLGALIIGKATPWISVYLGSTLLSPLNKSAPPCTDARPVNAKDRDYATWLQGMNNFQKTAIGKKVAPQQLAVGIKSGNQVLTYGLKLLLEAKKQAGDGVTLVKRDIENAHNSFFRDALMTDIRNLIPTYPQFKAIDRLADAQLSQQPQVYTRSHDTGTGMKKLCRCESGGEQGSAITNSLYPLSIDFPLKETERLHPKVKIRAFQDDMTSIGKAEDMFGENKSLECLEQLLGERGSRVKVTKDRAYGSTQEERDKIPDTFEQPHLSYIDAEGKEAIAYGLENCGVPMGDDAYVLAWLREKAEDIAEKMDFVSTHLSNMDPHSSYAVTYLSLQTQAEFIMSTNRPSETAAFATTVNSAIQRAFARSLKSDLLADPDPLHEQNVHLPDPHFVRDRALLRARLGGAAIRLIDGREHYLNCINNVLPQLIDRKETNADTITPGFFTDELTDALGEGSFDVENSQVRLQIFLASGSAYAKDFQEQYTLGKKLHEDITRDLQLIPDPSSIYNTEIHGFGANIAKLQKKIIDERQNLLFLQIKKRAALLPADDPRRISFFATINNDFASKLLGNMPNRYVPFSPDEFTTAVAVHMGVKIPALASFIGSQISNNRRCQQLCVDPYGHNLSTIAGTSGGSIQHNHNSILSTVSLGLTTAGIVHKGGASDSSCKPIFKAALPSETINITDDTPSSKELKSIIPDMVVFASELHTKEELCGANHIIDVKTVSARQDFYMDGSTTPGSAVEKRQSQVNRDYFNTAKKLDTNLHGTTADTAPGPFTKVLLAYGNENNRVLGPTVGFFGEASSDLNKLRDLVCAGLAERHIAHYRCELEQAKGLHRHLLNHKWGHTIKRGWAKVILTRLRDHVGPQVSLGDDRGDRRIVDRNNMCDGYNYYNPTNGGVRYGERLAN